MAYILIFLLLASLCAFTYGYHKKVKQLTAEMGVLQRYLSDPRFSIQPSGRFREDLKSMEFFVEYTRPDKIDKTLSQASVESMGELIGLYINVFEIRHGRHPEYTELAFVPIETIRSQLYAFR